MANAVPAETMTHALKQYVQLELGDNKTVNDLQQIRDDENEYEKKKHSIFTKTKN